MLGRRRRSVKEMASRCDCRMVVGCLITAVCTLSLQQVAASSSLLELALGVRLAAAALDEFSLLVVNAPGNDNTTTALADCSAQSHTSNSPTRNSVNRWSLSKTVYGKSDGNLTLRTLLATKKLSGGRIPYSPRQILWGTFQTSCLNQC